MLSDVDRIADSTDWERCLKVWLPTGGGGARVLTRRYRGCCGGVAGDSVDALAGGALAVLLWLLPLLRICTARGIVSLVSMSARISESISPSRQIILVGPLPLLTMILLLPLPPLWLGALPPELKQCAVADCDGSMSTRRGEA